MARQSFAHLEGKIDEVSEKKICYMRPAASSYSKRQYLSPKESLLYWVIPKTLLC